MDNQLDKHEGKQDLAKQAMDIDLTMDATDIPVSLAGAKKLSIADIAGLGSAFAGLAQALTASGSNIARVTDALGNPVPIKMLQQFANGSGRLGSYLDPETVWKQAHLHELGALENAVMGIDPVALAMAAMLMEMNKKLDDIQETQKEMFEYIKNRDKAKIRGDLEALGDVLANYKFNWDNEAYKKAKRILVQDIKKDAAQASIQHRAQLKSALDKGGMFARDANVRAKADAVKDELQEYRLSVYLYAFSSFLEVMLLENFDAGYLRSTRNEIERRALAYKEMYTQAYDVIEKDAGSSIRAGVLKGAAGAMGFLGKAVEKTRLGDISPIDEALIGASEGVSKFSKSVEQGMLEALVDASSSDVRPFIENIDEVNRINNEPSLLLVTDDAVYLVPEEVA